MITQINSFSPETKQNKTSFGTAYRIDSRWKDMFDPKTEQELISKITNKAKLGALQYLGNDGVIHHFRTYDGDIYYSKELKGMMGNVKYVPRMLDEDGFYVIDNKLTNIDSSFGKLKELLNRIIIKSRGPSATHINEPTKVLRRSPIRHSQDYLSRYS